MTPFHWIIIAMTLLACCWLVMLIWIAEADTDDDDDEEIQRMLRELDRRRE